MSTTMTMNEATHARRRITSSELLAMADDGVERWIIHGELREGGLTRRNQRHSRATARFSQRFWNWVDRQPEPRGAVLDGEAGFRLRDDPEELVGIDMAYIDASLAASSADEEGIIDGVPVLVVEVLSPSDQYEDVDEKIDVYLDCGVKLVWIVDPNRRTITVYRTDREPELFNVTQTIDAEPYLLGFRVPVAEFFA